MVGFQVKVFVITDLCCFTFDKPVIFLVNNGMVMRQEKLNNIMAKTQNNNGLNKIEVSFLFSHIQVELLEQLHSAKVLMSPGSFFLVTLPF